MSMVLILVSRITMNFLLSSVFAAYLILIVNSQVGTYFFIVHTRLTLNYRAHVKDFYTCIKW